MNTEKIKSFVDTTWDSSILPVLQDYIRIPNKSVIFDRQWQQHGYMEKDRKSVV